MTAFVRTASVALVFAIAALGQARDQRTATVGMRAYVEEVVLEGSELVPAPSTFEAPVVVRVLAARPHGEHLRYDLEWVGFEPGSYDLVDFLVRKDGSDKEGLASIEVEVEGLLPGTEFEPSELDPQPSQPLGGYSTLQVVVAVLWGLGLIGILFVGRRRKPAPPPVERPPTLADRLRPLVARVASGDADEAAKAELERLLLAFWRSRLDLGGKKAGDAIAEIRRHDEAGALLRQVEAWLHAPTPPRDFDAQALLRPYRDVSAEDFDREGG